jgi:hypothetical protein
MPTKQLNPSDPFDFNLMELSYAMYTNPGTLLGKLRFIWEKSCSMIRCVEVRSPQSIEKIWGVDAKKAMNSPSVLARAHFAGKRISKPNFHDNAVASAYFGALAYILNIQQPVDVINNMSGIQIPTLYGENSDQLFIDGFLVPEKLKCDKFLNKVVPHFFALQLHCHNLVRMLGVPSGVPCDPSVRKKRSVAGGAGSNYGEEKLKSMISDFLEAQNPENKYLDIDQLFESLESGLGEVLKKYKSLIGTRPQGESRTLTYGHSLKTTGILRKLNTWKKDQKFRPCLERICTIPDNGRTTP